MRVPQVSERIKEAPAQALRGVFAGIGQVLLIADRLRNKPPVAQQVPPARAPQPSATRVDPATSATRVDPATSATSAAPARQAPSVPRVPAAPAAPSAAPAKRVTQARDLDKTGNVRLLTSKEAGAGRMAPTTDATLTVGKDTAVAGDAAPTAEAGPGAPLPNYDELSVASLRARLRNLDVAQVRQLAEYEKAHAGRADVMTMFERRIAKLEAETMPEERGAAEAEAEVEAQEEVAAEVGEEVGVEAEGED
jgi:hypothetical protein